MLASVKKTGRKIVFVGPQPHHGILPEDIEPAVKINQAVSDYFATVPTGKVTRQNYALCHGMQTIGDTAYLVRDYALGKPLSNARPLSINKILERGIELADITEGVHQAGFSLVNFHPGHWLVSGSKPYSLVLMNFFGAEPVVQDEPGRFIKGVAGYRSPFLLRGEAHENQDTWGVAAIVYELLTNHVPFPNDQVGLHPTELHHTARSMEHMIARRELALDIPIYRGLPKRGLYDVFMDALSARSMSLNALRNNFKGLLPSEDAKKY